MFKDLERVLPAHGLVKESGMEFSIELSPRLFTGTYLTPQAIARYLHKEGIISIANKLDKDIFEMLRMSFGHEPITGSHLQIGNNVFCVFTEQGMTLMSLISNGESGIRDITVVSNRLYNKPTIYLWVIQAVR